MFCIRKYFTVIIPLIIRFNETNFTKARDLFKNNIFIDEYVYVYFCKSSRLIREYYSHIKIYNNVRMYDNK